MKKIGILISVCLLLVGCTKYKKEKEEFTYILFATPLSEHTIWLQSKAGYDAACEKYDIKCDWIGPNVIDTEAMQSVIETAIMQDADGIITQGVIDPALVDRAYQAGVPIFLVDSDIPNSQRFAYMGKDFKEQAQLLLDEIENKYGKKEHLKIAIQVAESSFYIAQEQIRQVEEVFQKHEGGFEIVSISESKSDPVRSKKEWSIVLEANPEINVALSFAAESAEFCAERALELNRKQDMLIYGVDDMPSTLEMIKNGKIDGTVATSFYDYGYQGVEMLLEYINKGVEPSQKVYSPSLLIVNRENVNTYGKNRK